MKVYVKGYTFDKHYRTYMFDAVEGTLKSTSQRSHTFL